MTAGVLLKLRVSSAQSGVVEDCNLICMALNVSSSGHSGDMLCMLWYRVHKVSSRLTVHSNYLQQRSNSAVEHQEPFILQCLMACNQTTCL